MFVAVRSAFAGALAVIERPLQLAPPLDRDDYGPHPTGRRVEELLAELDDLTHRRGALNGSRLPALRDELRKLGDLLAREAPDPTRLRTSFETIATELEQLHSGALDFMRSLDRVVARGELVDDAEFERCKGALLEHLQGFRRERNRHEEEIVAAIARVDRLGVARLAELIVAADDIPDLPDHPAARVRRDRETEVGQQWAGVRSWFIGSSRTRSPWEVLGEKVIQAIRAILDIAEAIVDRRTGRADRAHACVHLAPLRCQRGLFLLGEPVRQPFLGPRRGAPLPPGPATNGPMTSTSTSDVKARLP